MSAAEIKHKMWIRGLKLLLDLGEKEKKRKEKAPLNSALKEEGGARTAHWLERRSCDACVSRLAGGSRENQGKKHGRRGTVEGRKRASWRQSTQSSAHGCCHCTSEVRNFTPLASDFSPIAGNTVFVFAHHF